MKRIGVFLDMQNIYLSTKSVFGRGKINLANLRNYFEKRHFREQDHVTFTAFMSYDPENNAQVAFLNAISLVGYRVVAKPIQRLPDGTIKANMDLEIAIEIMGQVNNLDEVVLVSGDGDFKVLVDFISRLGKICTVVGPDKQTSLELIRACHHFVNLQSIPGIMEVD